MGYRPLVNTDHKWKQFKYRDDVPRGVLASQFDYQDEDVIDGYFKYYGDWYHLDQFERVPKADGEKGGLSGWDGVHHTSWSTGVLIKLSPDGEEYQVGTYRLVSD
jgi:hypothetical protein